MSTKRCGFNINLSIVIDIPESGHSIWLDPEDNDEVNAYLNYYLKDVTVFSRNIGEMVQGYGASTVVNEVRFWKDE